MPYSKNANTSLNKVIAPILSLVWRIIKGKKLDDALLLPVFVSMANRNFWSKAALRICTDYKSIGNRPLYI